MFFLFIACLKSIEKCHYCCWYSVCVPLQIFKWEWKESQNRPVFEHFLIVNEALRGNLPKLEGQWWRLVRTEGSREGEGASCGDTVTKGTPKPLQPPSYLLCKVLNWAVECHCHFHQGPQWVSNFSFWVWWACVAHRLFWGANPGLIDSDNKGGHIGFKDVQ